jgi:hypothetical protein
MNFTIFIKKIQREHVVYNESLKFKCWNFFTINHKEGKLTKHIIIKG